MTADREPWPTPTPGLPDPGAPANRPWTDAERGDGNGSAVAAAALLGLAFLIVLVLAAAWVATT